MQRPLLALALAMSCTAQAAPDDSPDAVLQFLNDRGVLAATVEPLHRARHLAAEMASDLVVSAMTLLGVPYRRGGESADSGFDCSGFTRHVFESTLGLALPRRADQQARDAALAPVARSELRPGDLVFFNTMRRAFSHVGIYVGDGRFIHAPRSGGQVRIEHIDDRYWRKRFDGARRATLEPAQPLR